jgi:hypothetical protein
VDNNVLKNICKLFIVLLLLFLTASCGRSNIKEDTGITNGYKYFDCNINEYNSESGLALSSWESWPHANYEHIREHAQDFLNFQPDVHPDMEVTFVYAGEETRLHDGCLGLLNIYICPETTQHKIVFRLNGEPYFIDNKFTALPYVIYINANTILLVDRVHANYTIHGFTGWEEKSVSLPIAAIKSIEPGYITLWLRLDVLGTSYVEATFSYMWLEAPSHLFNGIQTRGMMYFVGFDTPPWNLTLREDITAYKIQRLCDGIITVRTVLQEGTIVTPVKTNGIDIIIFRCQSDDEYLVNSYSRQYTTIQGIHIFDLFDGLSMAG